MLKKIISTNFFIISAVTILFAQQAILTGGTIVKNKGHTSISYSIGQIFSENSLSSEGLITSGVQQPFEILAQTESNVTQFFLSWEVYPNPTNSFLILNIENYTELSKLGPSKAEIYNLNGKLMLKENIDSEKKSIDMTHLKPKIYVF